MENKAPEQRKKSVFGLIWPYIIVIGLIAVLLYMIFGKDNRGTVLLNETQTAEVLAHEDVTKVTVREETTITYITGKYVDTTSDGTTYTVNFKCEMHSSAYSDKEVFKYETTLDGYTSAGEYSIAEIIEYRLRDKDKDGVYESTYYTADIRTYENAFETNWFLEYLPTIIFLGIGLVIAFVLFSRLSASVNSSNNKAMEFNKSRARREDTSHIRFDDVAGCDEEKAELVEMVDYLKNPRKYSRFGAKLPKGVLLVGPPGTGKTLLAKAVAGEAGVPFFSISGSDFVELYVGVGAGRVRDMFKKAKQSAPCLIFIDEIDAVGRQRGAGLGGGNDEREQTLNQLLVELDGFSDNAGILVMAATNRDDVLDPALLRAGRFDRQITVDLPNAEGREAILKVHARNKVIDENVDFKAIAKRTTGFSGADLENVLNEAAILAVRFNKESVSMVEIDEAIDRRIAGPAKNTHAMTEKERRQVAYHEAGHAICGLKLPYSDKVQKITIVPRGRTGGHVLMGPEEDRFLLTKNELIAEIAGLLGGRASEEIFFGDVSTGAHNDIERATRIARAMVVEYGMSPLGPIQYENNTSSVFLGRDYNNSQRNFSTQIAFEIDKEIRKLIDDAHDTAIKVINDNKDDLILIAETLLERDTINQEEIVYLLEHRSLKGFGEKVAEVKEENKPSSEEPSEEVPTKGEQVMPISAGEAKAVKPRKPRAPKTEASKTEEKKEEKGEE